MHILCQGNKIYGPQSYIWAFSFEQQQLDPKVSATVSGQTWHALPDQLLSKK